MATNKYCLKCFEYNKLDCGGVSDKNKEPKCYLFRNNRINKYSEQWDKLPELNKNILSKEYVASRGGIMYVYGNHETGEVAILSTREFIDLLPESLSE